MRSLIYAELLKIRTTRMLAVTIGVVLVIAGALPVVYGAAAGSGDLPPLVPANLADMVTAPAWLAGGAVLLIGLLASAGEYRHRTIYTTRLAEPRPLRVLAAKLAAITVIGLAVGVAVDIVAAGAGGAVLAHHGLAIDPFSHGVPRLALVIPLVLVLHGILGVAIGAVLRSTTAAVGATLIWAFVVEGIIPALTNNPDLVNWLPRGALREVLSTQPTPGQLAPLAAAALLVGYAAALVATSAVLDRRREL
jgi:ABC-2 type transport system permease protein